MAGSDVIVLADDATGALEAAAACADHGLPCVVGEAPEPGDRALVIDLDSRHLDSQSVAQASGWRQVDAARRQWPTVPVVHKIDSTLRGNWPQEMACLAERFPGRPIAVIAAHPSAGRTCVHGQVLVNGVPLAETTFAADARCPIHSSRVADYLTGISLPSLHILDATSLTMVDAQVAAHVDALLVGPAAVVRSMAARLGPLQQPPALPQAQWTIVCGSAHPASRQQCAVAEQAGWPVLASPDLVQEQPVLPALVSQVQAAVAAGSRFLLVCGGETLRALVDEGTALRAWGTVSPGVVLAQGQLAGEPVTFLSKPGGFGTPHLILDLIGKPL